MRWKPHVRFGGRAGETDLSKGRHRAPVRSHWATEALDVLRRQAWNEARAVARTEPKGRAGRPRKDGTQASGPRPGHDLAKALKGARYALWKNPENLTETQQTKLA